MVLGALAGGTLLGVALYGSGPYLAPDLWPVALGLSGAWAARRAYLLDRALRAWQRLQTCPAWTMRAEELPGAEQGMYLGKGFRWTADHTQQLETALYEDKMLPEDPARGGYPALHAVGYHDECDFRIPWTAMNEHTLCTATTGWGKTNVLELATEQAIAAPGAVVVLNPKGGRKFLARCAAAAKRAGKPFAFVSPTFPQHSATMNVLGSATTQYEVTARISALMPAGKSDPFFREFPLTLLECIAAAQQAIGQPWTLAGIYEPAMFQEPLEKLTVIYMRLQGLSTAPKWKDARNQYHQAGKKDLIAEQLLEDLAHDRQNRRQVTANLYPTFRGMILPPLAPLWSSLTPNISWPKIAQQQMVVYISLSSLLLRDIANRIGRIILQDLMGFVGWRYEYADLKQALPITMVVDEVARVAYADFPIALAMSREAKVRFILAQQSFSDMEATLLDRTLADQVYENCNVRIFGRVSDTTAKKSTEGLGTCTVQLPDTSTGIGYGGVGGLSGHTARRLVNTPVDLVRLEWLGGLPSGEAYVRLHGALHKVRIPMLEEVSERQVDELGLTAVWQKMREEEEKELVQAHQEVKQLLAG
jgi:conjugal transfer pilus assembly protein TraD